MSKKNLFKQVEMTHLKSNVFDLSHDVKLSMKMGNLVPIMCEPVIPGDNWRIGCESLIRFAPLVAPVMHRMDVTMHYFFCPNRLVWPAWETYIAGTKSGTDEPTHPFITLNGNSANPTVLPLANYFGIPFSGDGGQTENINALPFAMYQKIYNEYYRDQNLISEARDFCVDGNNSAFAANLLVMQKRAWEHDYFTACLPNPQQGASVSLPLGTVELNGASTNAGVIVDAATQTPLAPGGPLSIGLGGELLSDDVGGVQSAYDPNGTLQVGATTISDLRRATKLQEWLEKAMRGGNRYIEFIRSMFGVQSSDKRLQRPEYITGIKSPVVISEVLNTTGTEDLPQGNMAGHGVSVVSGEYGSYYAEEHGYIIGIMSVMPKTAYQQGIPKHFLKINDKYEHYFEQFAHIGEQEVLERELKAFTSGYGSNTFGYIPRYSEYKFANNRTAGDFQTTLDYWTLTRQFATGPALNQTFIECVPDTRIFAVEDGTDYLWCHVYNKVSARRKMAFFGTPRF